MQSNLEIDAIQSGNEIFSKLSFRHEDGQILLGQKRMLLLHGSGFGILRRELIESLGIERAKGILMRIGYHNGAHDADLANHLRGMNVSTSSDILMGPLMHMLEGSAKVIPVTVELDEEQGQFHAELVWEKSIEAEEHLKVYPSNSESVCWMQVGYASGFSSRFMGKPILFREVECVGCGAKHCRIVGRPVDEWIDEGQDLEYMKADVLSDGLSTSLEEFLSCSVSDAPFKKPSVVGVSAGFNSICHKIRRVADTNATVLFLGESGVGKEVFARSLHAISPRGENPFVAVNCAAIPEDLVESELFGVDRGAFTGAQTSRPGRFERANGGTIFLDEIGILSMTAQGKLLRAIQEREIERVGGTQVIQIDVRILAATNLDLKHEVAQGRFREDLFYRLNVVPIAVPPLRKRREDIPVFMHHFLSKFRQLHNRSVSGFTRQAIGWMLSHPWPGNIRELENTIERGVIMASEGCAVDVADLLLEPEVDTDDDPGNVVADSSAVRAQDIVGKKDGNWEGSSTKKQLMHLLEGTADLSKPIALRDIENLVIQQTLELTNNNKAAAARMLRITRSQLLYRLKN